MHNINALYSIARRLPRIVMMVSVIWLISLYAHGMSKSSLSDNLRDIKDKQVTDTLPDVIVSAELETRRGNEDIIVVTKNMRKGTHNAGELLGKVNGMQYNPMTTDLTYMGSKNIMVLVDSVEKDLSYIKRLQPGRFDRINIVNMPTGKYSGYDAVISLHTIPKYEGYEGVVMAQSVISPNGRNGKGNDLKQAQTTGQFTYTNRKINIDFIADWKRHVDGLDFYRGSEYPLNGFTESDITPFSYSSPNKENTGMNSVGDLSLDYEINSRHSVSVRGNIAPSWVHERSMNTILRKYAEGNRELTFTEKRNNDIKNRLDFMYGVWYRGKVERWSLDANLTYNHIAFKRLFGLERSTDFSLTDDRRYTARYLSGGVSANSYAKNGKWSYSVSDYFSLTDYEETAETDGCRLSSGDYFRNRLDAALYYFPNRNLYIGLNAGASVDRSSEAGIDNTHVSPRGGMQFMWNHPSRKFVMRFYYSAYSSSPSLSLMQSFAQFTDSLVMTTGNPDLKPALVNDFNFTLSVLGMFTLNARYILTSKNAYSFVNSDFGMIPSGVETYFASTSYVNGRNDKWNVTLTFAKDFRSHWSVSATAKVRGEKASYRRLSSDKVLPAYDWYVMYHTLKNSLQVYLSGSMTSYSTITPQTRMWNIEDGFALSVCKYFLNNQLQVLGMWTLPLHLTTGERHGGMVSQPLVTRQWGSSQNRQNNLLQFSVLYSFKGGKSVTKYNRQIETVDL